MAHAAAIPAMAPVERPLDGVEAGGVGSGVAVTVAVATAELAWSELIEDVIAAAPPLEVVAEGDPASLPFAGGPVVEPPRARPA